MAFDVTTFALCKQMKSKVYLDFPEEWWPYCTSAHSTYEFIQQVLAYHEDMDIACTYEGEVAFNDMPGTLGNAECIVEVIHNTNRNVVCLTLRSTNTFPREWILNTTGEQAQCVWVPMIGLAAPTTQGTYKLRCTVNSAGTPIFSWVADA